ncbi:Cyclin-like F-box [Purpureocillium lavendulum]|uniref:Cyclin-like F-box n=1 Tax=Purpureocillium lavendulum TaxID=1247861 RepID=A0AB34FKG8_9HYPO|nr:Cyclin-like F-box [Purpureocillium lavendulum]
MGSARASLIDQITELVLRLRHDKLSVSLRRLHTSQQIPDTRQQRLIRPEVRGILLADKGVVRKGCLEGGDEKALYGKVADCDGTEVRLGDGALVRRRDDGLAETRGALQGGECEVQLTPLNSLALTNAAAPSADHERARAPATTMALDDVDPHAVTLARGVEPFVMTPVVADLLRTRFPIPGSIFLVEGVDAHRVGRSGSWEAVRLLLGDGDLCVQALLDDKMHRFVRSGAVAVGSYVRVQSFELRWARQKAPADHDQDQDAAAGGGGGGGGKGKQKEAVGAPRMVYLLVKDLVTIGWNESVKALHLAELAAASNAAERGSGSASRDTNSDAGNDAGQESSKAPQLPYQHLDAPVADRHESKTPALPTKMHGGNTASPAHTPTRRGSRKRDVFDDTSDADLEDAFDAMEAHTFPQRKSTPSRSRTSTPGHQASALSAAATTAQPIPLPRDWHSPQNWSVNVLAIVAELSPVEPSHLPPYRQRTARLADPSTAKQVHLTVFLDPESFAPKVGSAVLLTGVKNHCFDGGSLKKYASDGKEGKRWWFEEPWELAWCDVRGIKEWWAQMEAAMAEDLDDFDG